jgi:RNase H-like domain found in reverse transcriptase/Reverse transcriptase (RNA-dependent DNA polymerase)/Integrase zinc binding domain/Integrase core domain/Chromo (CHRromatin Organisation MOdifier) domain/Aspartyl protease
MTGEVQSLGKWSTTNAMVDSGCTSEGIIDTEYAKKRHLNIRKLERDLPARGFNGKVSWITHYVVVKLRFGRHLEHLSLYVHPTKDDYDIMLGHAWLKRHNPRIDWINETLKFDAQYCRSNCLHGLSWYIHAQDYSNTTRYELPLSRTANRNEDSGRNAQQKTRDLVSGSNMEKEDSSPKPLEIRQIRAEPFYMLARKRDHEIFAITMEDIEKALNPKPYVDPRPLVPEEYHDLIDVFEKRNADKLAPHREDHDFKIELESGKTPSFGPLYGMSREELMVLRKYLDDHLAKGWIRPSQSPFASPVIFVRKPGGGLRFCVDYRALNAITVRNRYPIPLIQETLDRLAKARYFTKVDVIAAFNKIRVREGDEKYTAFRTRWGLFEYLVMPFGVKNGPGTFQQYINDTLRDLLDVFVTAYIDDILIYSSTMSEHRKHVRMVLERLRDAGLQCDISKCKFHASEVTYLGLIVSRDGIKMDPKKVEAITGWKSPENVHDVRSFLGFANFYRRFIKHFSKIVQPLVNLTKKTMKFLWDDKCERAFNDLKKRFTTAPILAHFNPDLECVLETDSSDHAQGGVLSQYDKNGVLLPIAYFSRKLNAAESNYEIYDKELLAIIQCFEQWRPELEGSMFPVKVLTDHKNLQYFMTTKQLTHRQTRWAEYLSRFDFKIMYRPGKQGQKPDALTRRSQDLPANSSDERIANRLRVLLPPERFEKIRLVFTDPELNEDMTETDKWEMDLEDLMDYEYKHDPWVNEILTSVRTGQRQHRDITLSECEIRNDRLYYRDTMVVPNSEPLRFKILEFAHDAAIAGHPGRAKTYEIVQRSYYWPLMHDFVRRYVRSCPTCSRAKPWHAKKQGVLRPLPIPMRRWRDISIDFVVGLPMSNGHTNIMVVIDRLTKMRHLIPLKTLDTIEVAEAFTRHVFKLHGLPTTIISDRGTQFVSMFWKTLCERLGIESRLSTAHHPETDGQTENANAIMEQYLRMYCSYLQDDWEKWLPLAEFTANNTKNESTNMTPFYATYGQDPRLGFEPRTEIDENGPMIKRLQQIDANNFADRMNKLTELLRSELTYAQAVQEYHANKGRLPAYDFKEGDKVYLNTRNLRTQRPSKKLDWKFAGKYTIRRKVSPYAYELELPAEMKIHPTFHVNLLLPSKHDPIGRQVPEPPPMVIENGEGPYFVDSIDDMKWNTRSARFELLIKWEGYEQRTWEPYITIKKDAPELVKEFHADHPSRPAPAGWVKDGSRRLPPATRTAKTRYTTAERP